MKWHYKMIKAIPPGFTSEYHQAELYRDGKLVSKTLAYAIPIHARYEAMDWIIQELNDEDFNKIIIK